MPLKLKNFDRDTLGKLTIEAKRELDRVEALLRERGAINEASRAMLEVYAALWSRWQQAERAIAKEGATQESDSGRVFMNPWVRIGNDAIKECRMLAGELGIIDKKKSPARAKDTDDRSKCFNVG